MTTLIPAAGEADLPAIARDPAELERFYRAHYDEVVGYLAGRISDPHDLADLVADTFLAAVDAAHTYDPRRGRALPWLIGIAHNKMRRFHRARAGQHQIAQRVMGRRLLDADDIAALVERIDAEATGALGLLDQLTADQREVVELVDLKGFTPAEVAQALGITAGTARIRLHRARKALRRALNQQSNQQSDQEER